MWVAHVNEVLNHQEHQGHQETAPKALEHRDRARIFGRLRRKGGARAIPLVSLVGLVVQNPFAAPPSRRAEAGVHVAAKA